MLAALRPDLSLTTTSLVCLALGRVCSIREVGLSSPKKKNDEFLLTRNYLHAFAILMFCCRQRWKQSILEFMLCWQYDNSAATLPPSRAVLSGFYRYVSASHALCCSVVLWATTAKNTVIVARAVISCRLLCNNYRCCAFTTCTNQ